MSRLTALSPFLILFLLVGLPVPPAVGGSSAAGGDPEQAPIWGIPVPHAVGVRFPDSAAPAPVSVARVADRPADHVVLISIDGLRPDFYLDERWPAPTLRRLAAEGAMAEQVLPVFPSLTFPGHTTLVTGASPARHGILHNQRLGPASVLPEWMLEFSAIGVPTLWEAVSEAGGSTAALAWPVTVGAPIDWNLPAIWDVTGREAWGAMVRRSAHPPGLIEELEAEAVGRLPDDALGGSRLSQEDRIAAMADYLLRRYRPTLLTVHLVVSDSWQHRHGPEFSPDVAEAVVAVDRAVSRILEGVNGAGIAERTAIIITGDHGFTRTDTVLAPNVWLEAAGFGAPAADSGVPPRAAFLAAGGAAFLRFSDAGSEPPAARLDSIRSLLGGLPAGIASAFRIIERAELDSLGADPEAFLALAAAPGFTFSGARSGPAAHPSPRPGGHGHHPATPGISTGFIAWGAGVSAGARLSAIHQTDVAPVVATLLDLSFQAPDGRLPEGVVVAR